MSRALLALLLVGSLGLLTVPPADAATTLSLVASHRVVRDGQPIRFTGKVTGAPPRSLVELQSKGLSGWSTLRTTRARAGAYAFAIGTPRGKHKYRVVKPAAAGSPRAYSRPVLVARRWRPTVRATADAAFDGQHRPVVRVSGAIDGRAQSVELHRRLGRAAGWSVAATVGMGSRRRFTFPAVAGPRLAEFRVVVPGDAGRFRLTGRSAVLASPRTTYALPLDHGVTLFGLSTVESTTSVSVQAARGTEVTLAADAPPGSSWRGDVTGPAGQQLGALGTRSGDEILRFTAPETGVYNLDVDQLAGDAMTVWASQPRSVSVDGTYDHLPGQVVELHRTMTTGRVGTLAWSDPAGVEVEAVGAGSRALLLTQFPGSGEAGATQLLVSLTNATQTIRLLPRTPATRSTSVALRLHGTARSVTVNGGGVALRTSPDAPVVAMFHAVQGQIIDTSYEFPFGPDTPPAHVVHGPDGSYVPCGAGPCGSQQRRIVAPATGIYILVFTDPYGEGSGEIHVTSPHELTAEVDGEGSSFDMTGQPYRRLRVRFDGTAGEIVSLTYDFTKLGADRNYSPLPRLFVLDHDQVWPVWPVWPDGPGFLLESDGSHVFDTYLGDTVGTVSVLSGHEVDLAVGGTPVTFDIDRKDRLVYAHLEAEPGSTLRLASTESTLASRWLTSVVHDGGFVAGMSGQSEGEPKEVTFTVPADGRFTVVTTSQVVESVKLSLAEVA